MSEICVEHYPNCTDVASDPRVDEKLADWFLGHRMPEQATLHHVAFEDQRAIGGLVTVLRMDGLTRIDDVYLPPDDEQKQVVSGELLDAAEETAELIAAGIIAKPQDVTDIAPVLEERGYQIVTGPSSEAVFFRKAS